MPWGFGNKNDPLEPGVTPPAGRHMNCIALREPHHKALPLAGAFVAAVGGGSRKDIDT